MGADASVPWNPASGPDLAWPRRFNYQRRIKKVLEGASAGRRMKAIGEAVAWPKGQSPQKQIDQTVYSRSGFDVRLGKPGKETLRVGAARKPEDMLPKMFALGTMIPMPASFEDIIERLETDCAEDELSHVGAAHGRLLS